MSVSSMFYIISLKARFSGGGGENFFKKKMVGWFFLKIFAENFFISKEI